MRAVIPGLLLAAVLAVAGACAGDETSAPPPAPPAFANQGQGHGKTSLDLIEEDYSSGVLDRDNANRYRQYAVSAPERLPPRYRSEVIGKDATASMLRMALDWDQLAAPTRQEIQDLQADGFGQLKETRETPHFVLHYTTQGAHAVPAVDADGNGTPDYVDVAARSYERVWQREIVELGYPAPKGTPAEKFHVYFQNLRLYYGYTAALQPIETIATSPFPLGTAAAYVVVENDFAEGFPPNDEDVTGREEVRSGAQKVTNAHEFMHASQFNLNIYQSGWLFESHATWAEDQVYDEINDWRWYVQRFLDAPDLPIFNRFVYGSAFFQHYLSETYGVDVPRQIWFAARTRSTPDAVRDAAFGGSWEPMKEFGPAEYLLRISDYTRDPASVVPRPRNRIRATHTSYPVDAEVPPSKGNFTNRAPWGLGANFIEFEPAGSGELTLRFDGADGFAWRAFAVATGRGPAQVTEIPLDRGSAGSLTIGGFGARWSKVTLVPTIADRPGAEVPFRYGADVK
ncbi:MAG TPA: MXAN_6640 family putative metalloprotease [Gemmatimonadales bacterium]|nr:MXAN_6640 family putative metalloprotease [Gemmatimonadales bacterium]